MSQIGDRIRKAREAAKLTQAQLGKRLKASEHTVRKWENGTRTPHLTRLRAIAKALKVEVGDLL